MTKNLSREQWRNRIVGYDVKPASQFQAHPLNARRHPGAQRDALRGLLGEVGWVDTVLENVQTGNTIDGHARIEEALSKGDETPVPYLKIDLSPDEEKLVLASFDPIGAMASYDREVLDKLLHEASTGDSALQEMLSGLAESEGLYFGEKKEEDESEVAGLIDRAAELREKWKVQDGQVWNIGNHRLMCGNSLDVKDVSLLTQNQRIDGICTDPPYELHGQQVRDALEMVSDVAIVLAADKQAFELTRFWDFRLDFIFHHRKSRSFPTKNLPVFFHTHCVVIARTARVKTGWQRPRPDFGSIIEVENEYEDNEMGHGKSSELFQEMLAGFKWKTVGDPFVGTGASLLACEAQGRVLLGMEREPKTLAVALERATRAGLTVEV
jgi:hypothetical protein